MARAIKRGDIYLYTFKKPDKTRPVVVLSRDDVIPLISTVMVAPILSSIYGVPSEVVIGIDHGLKNTSAINLDHIQTVDKSRLKKFIAHLDNDLFEKICLAINRAIGCNPR